MNVEMLAKQLQVIQRHLHFSTVTNRTATLKLMAAALIRHSLELRL